MTKLDFTQTPKLVESYITVVGSRNDIVLNVLMSRYIQELVGRFAEVIVDDGRIVVDWRTPLSAKYTKYPGIRSQHDFVFTRNVATCAVITLEHSQKEPSM